MMKVAVVAVGDLIRMIVHREHQLHRLVVLVLQLKFLRKQRKNHSKQLATIVKQETLDTQTVLAHTTMQEVV
jgi:hypothetical protein